MKKIKIQMKFINKLVMEMKGKKFKYANVPMGTEIFDNIKSYQKTPSPLTQKLGFEYDSTYNTYNFI